jgi:cell wall-associated NlpC family hydrolase/SH3-like domain-containing protein/Sec-independent protein translocase protein TatA|nr:C40 family peptidase [Clostridium sp. CM74B_53]
MNDDKDTVNYMDSINKASRKRRRKPSFWEHYGILVIGAAVLAVIALAVLFGGKAVTAVRSKMAAAQAASESAAESESAEESSLAAEEESRAEIESESEARDAKIQEVIDSYSNLGIAKVTGYLNIRKDPDGAANVVGTLSDGSACEILETLDGWVKISSGEVEGYASSEYILTGDEAKEAAKDLVKERAYITADNLNIRETPSTDGQIVGKCLQGELHEIVGEENGWYKISGGYISADYAEKRFCMNEANKLDMKAMVLNFYDRPGVSNVSNYLNIRAGAGENEKIIGKLPSYAGCEILEDANGWYKISSGGITGYVKSDYILTGDEAKQAAMNHAELMAIVHADRLNARTEPSTDAKIWTQISENERYHVAEQLDGWVKIEFDESGEGDGDDEISAAYVSSEFVEVRYALSEAIKFSPTEESASLRSRIVNYAMKFLGNPYVWGGTSLTKGADCSGFTMSVMKNFGISLPHYSGSQAKSGKRIKSSEMRPGDLVFYGNSRGRINHVAMYIGNGQVINAASRRSGIKISTWNYRTPICIVDVIGNRS